MCNLDTLEYYSLGLLAIGHYDYDMKYYSVIISRLL